MEGEARLETGELSGSGFKRRGYRFKVNLRKRWRSDAQNEKVKLSTGGMGG